MTVLSGVMFAVAMMLSSCSKEDATLQTEFLVASETEPKTAKEPDFQLALGSESQVTSQAGSQSSQNSESQTTSDSESEGGSESESQVSSDSASSSPSDQQSADDECNETLADQLETVRKLAIPFHSFKQAEKVGYADPSPFNPSPYVPHMGFHYTNGSLLDGTFELDKPEILLYVPNEQGKLKLVGVEYAVPGPPDSTPPEGFVGNEDHWHYNPNVAGGAWTLHVWVVLENPNGIFAELNPNVPAENSAEDCELP